jgi:hypothetical protein
VRLVRARGQADVVDGLAELIRAQMAAHDDPVVARWIFGVVDPDRIAAMFDAWASRELGAVIHHAWMWSVSVGCVAGVVLESGDRIVIKAYPPDRDVQRLEGVVALQRAANARGLPAPEPIRGPARMGNGLAVAERALDVGRRPQLTDPTDRRTAARGWLSVVELLEDSLTLLPRTVDEARVVDSLYPRPHSPWFDFEATSRGAEWIDALASDAARVMARTDGPAAVVHMDWRSDNIRLDDAGERVVAIFDWESVRASSEATALGLVAAMHSVDWFDPVGPYFATATECIEFAREVERARAARFSPTSWDAVVASIVFGWCYTARCEHARASVGYDHDQFGMRRRLALEGRMLLDSIAR